MKKWWIIVIVVVLMTGGGGTWFFIQHKNSQATVASTTTETTTVQKGKLEVSISGAGSVESIINEDVTAANTVLTVDSISVVAGEAVDKGETLLTFSNGDTVVAPYDGEITAVKVENGNSAAKGTILFRMENDDDIEAPVTRENASDSTEGSTVGGSSLSIDTVHVKSGDVVKKGAKLVTFTDGSILKAAVAGTITSLSVKSGDSIQGSDVVAHITDYTTLQTTISVDELDISKVKEGQAVTIIASAFEDEEFAGEVTSIAAEGTASNGVSTFEVTVKITDVKGLKMGMSTEATVLIESKEDALYVPVEAVYTSGDEKYVLVPSTDSSQSGEKVTVETGIANDMYVEITKGLLEGDAVEIPRVQSSGNSFPGGMMMQEGGTMIEGGFGGQMPSGERPSGSGGQPPSGNRGGN